MEKPAQSTQESSFRRGFVAIVGRPNVGKSTLLNRILGQKLSITSRKPQTTRHRILGIKTTGEVQTIYLDTPGLNLHGKRTINRYMNRAATGAMTGVDVILFVVESLRWTDMDRDVRNRLAKIPVPILLVINKVDTLSAREKLLPFIQEINRGGNYAEIIPLSARCGDNVAALENAVAGYLPLGDALFPEAQLTDRGERFFASEIVREKLTRRLGQELPYRLTVSVEHWLERERLLEISAVIWVERMGQKAIVIGKQGSVLKKVGSESRGDMERLFGKKIFLRLRAKVRANWSGDEAALRSLGLVEAWRNHGAESKGKG